MINLDETIREFLVESFENLDRLDQDLIALEESPEDGQVINQIFRIVHTVKGTCGFFDFKTLESVAHVGENLLDSLRDNKLQVSTRIINALLGLSDAIRKMLVSIEQSGHEGPDVYEELRNLLTALNSPVEPRESQPAAPTLAQSEPVIELKEAHEVSVDDELALMFAAAQQEYEQKRAVEEEPQAPVEASMSATATASIDDAKKSDVSETALRVDISLLDKLMNLVGELVLARNQILQFTKSQANTEFTNTTQRLDLITSELQEGVMRTRMQPIANVWNKLPRIVRDVAQSCGKQIRLEMHGKETELDKTIIEAIKDPLTHIIRNAVDHGIENPADRGAKKKPVYGTLDLKAYHEGGQVIIEIADDGAGLNVEKVRRKALERGLISTDKANRLTEQDVYRLIFLPGFSTAEKVTNISGRGVGMDVVRSNIERIGGTVDVSSREGAGTTFTIKIPLTLAIIPALIVSGAGQRYAIPQVNLLELVRVDSDQTKTKLEEIHGATFYRLRGKLLPLVRLGQELGLQPKAEKRDAEVLNIVVVRAENRQFGLIVESIFDTEEIVVKPLGKLLKGISSFAGATIMGDGQVALILDVVGLARRAHLGKQESAAQEDKAVTAESGENKRTLLVFQVANQRRAAVDLEAVHRLEEFDVGSLETSGDCTVVQYRNGILPIVDLSSALCGMPPNYSGSVKAFVYRYGDQYVGFAINNVVDIIEQAVKVETPFKRAGLAGSAIIQGVVTDLLDIDAIVQKSRLYDQQSEQVWTN